MKVYHLWARNESGKKVYWYPKKKKKIHRQFVIERLKKYWSCEMTLAVKS